LIFILIFGSARAALNENQDNQKIESPEKAKALYAICMGSYPASVLESQNSKDRSASNFVVNSRFTKIELLNNGKKFATIDEASRVEIELNEPKAIGFIWKQGWGDPIVGGVFELKPETEVKNEIEKLHIVINWEKKFEPEVSVQESPGFPIYQNNSISVYIPSINTVTIKESFGNWNAEYSMQPLCNSKSVVIKKKF
jgi:hypothetical protein